MRGIMVHSLMARGLSFEDAFRVANQVRDQIRGREVVPRDELARLIQKELGGEGVLEALSVQLPRTIHVVEDKHRTPFSKGVLAQSLLAAAIAPDQAFEVAREIEAELLRRRAEEVGRDQLRALVTATLERTMGERVAGLTLGVDWDYVGYGVDAPVAATVREAGAMFTELGARVGEIRMPETLVM